MIHRQCDVTGTDELQISTSSLKGPNTLPHVVLPATVNDKKTDAFLDPGANGDFVRPSFAQTHNLPLISLASPMPLKLADGTEMHQKVDSAVLLNITMGTHEEQRICYVAEMNYDVVLGLPWMATHAPNVDWGTGETVFDSAHCKDCCLREGRRCTVWSRNHVEKRKRENELANRTIDGVDVQLVSAAAFLRLAGRKHWQVNVIDMADTPTDTTFLQACGVSSADCDIFLKKPTHRSTRQMSSRSCQATYTI